MNLEEIGAVVISEITAMLKQNPAFSEFTKDPQSIERDIIEYQGKLRVSGLEKFNEPCFVSAVSLYPSEVDIEKNKATGAVILYMEEEATLRFLKMFNYKSFHGEDEDQLLEDCGDLCAKIAQGIQKKLQNSGYGSLVMGKPLAGRNTIGEGIDFKFSEYQYQQISFFLWKQKAMVIDITFPDK